MDVSNLIMDGPVGDGIAWANAFLYNKRIRQILLSFLILMLGKQAWRLRNPSSVSGLISSWIQTQDLQLQASLFAMWQCFSKEVPGRQYQPPGNL
jgi:hypothetical protein